MAHLTQGTVMLVLLAFLTTSACKSDPAQKGATSQTQLATPENAITETLMLTLGQARNLHHKADILESQGKLEEAAQSVRQVLSLPFPSKAPESEDVRLDSQARLAKLLLAQGQHSDALALVDQGIAQSTRASFFQANLHTVRGEVLEAQASLEGVSPSASRQAKVEAIKAFDASIQINEALLKSLK